jgi:hypothetical protein
MKARNILALLILVLGSLAAFYCYMRLAELLPMSNPDAVTRAEAKIISVDTPMVKKNETVSEVTSHVKFAFKADGKTIEGGYLVRDLKHAPKKGDKEPIAYRTQRPEVFLRAKDYDDLPRQLAALRWMMWGFALSALVVPFAVMKHGA